MERISVYDAKNNFSRIVNEIIEDNEKEVIVERYNRPVVRIIAYSENKKPRICGIAKKYKGKIDYDKLLELDKEIEADFEEA